jgi:hypothetical protein
MANAHKRDGSPNYGMRIAAARALLLLGDSPSTRPETPITLLVVYA